jgi:hypothetical protein
MRVKATGRRWGVPQAPDNPPKRKRRNGRVSRPQVNKIDPKYHWKFALIFIEYGRARAPIIRFC